ncbi:hypothetical protein [Bacillus sp. JCM 19041]|uniref:hypothetical protein n=1 Tax=Bacillus sp. JCM 19041 TaxID=1460637 RepID=UPI0006D0EAF1
MQVRIFSSIMLIGIGTLHFTYEKVLRRMIPKAFPFRKAAVLVTGVQSVYLLFCYGSAKGSRLRESY